MNHMVTLKSYIEGSSLIFLLYQLVTSKYAGPLQPLIQQSVSELR